MSEYTKKYISYASIHEAGSALQQLRENGIFCEMINSRLGLTHPLPQADEQFLLSYNEEDQEEVYDILQLHHSDPVMENMSDEELKEILYTSDEWNESLITDAERILKERNIDISGAERESRTMENLTKKEQAVRAPMAWIITGLIFSGTFMIIGFVFGASYYFLKGKRRNGESYYIYDQYTRNAGILMMIISGSMIVVAIYLYSTLAIN